MHLSTQLKVLSPARAFSSAFSIAIASAFSASAFSLALLPETTASAQTVPLKVEPYRAKNTSSRRIAANTTPQTASIWNAVDVADGGFQILLPGEIDRKVNVLQVDGKPVEQTLLLATQTQHDAFYMVAWSDLSVQDPLSEAERAKILDSTKASFLRSFRGNLTEQIRLKLAGNSGMQYSMTSRVRGNPFTITSRSYVVGNRLYQVLAAIPQRVEPYLIGSTNGFLRSFQLRPIEPAQVPAQALNQIPTPMPVSSDRRGS